MATNRTNLTATTVNLPAVAASALTCGDTIDLYSVVAAIHGHGHPWGDQLLSVGLDLADHLNRTIGAGVARVDGSGRTEVDYEVDEDGCSYPVPFSDVELFLDLDLIEHGGREDVLAEVECYVARIGVRRVTHTAPVWRPVRRRFAA